MRSITAISLHFSQSHWAESYLHTMRANANITLIPVILDNVLLIALPLNYVISPSQADNLSSRNADMLMVTTTTWCNGSFGTHYFLSTKIKCLPHTMKYTFIMLVAKKTGIVCSAGKQLVTCNEIENVITK